ncbi:MAG: DUF3883 domain-containing protein [Candidatus Korarchaeota archaeon]|nr:DUF3883 domain-containing protein [Candidatus Korarchaeota archaeon]
MSLHPNVVGYYARAGYRLELVVMESLEEILAILGIANARLNRVHSGAPYDIELIVEGRRAFIEVKGANDEDRLQWKVNQSV